MELSTNLVRLVPGLVFAGLFSMKLSTNLSTLDSVLLPVGLYMMELSAALIRMDPVLVFVGLYWLKLSAALVRLDPILVFVGLYSIELSTALDSELFFEFFSIEYSAALVILSPALEFWLFSVEIFSDGLCITLVIAAISLYIPLHMKRRFNIDTFLTFSEWFHWGVIVYYNLKACHFDRLKIV